MDDIINTTDINYLMSSGAQIESLPKEISAPNIENGLNDIVEAIQNKSVDAENIVKAIMTLAGSITPASTNITVDTTPIAEALSNKGKKNYRFSIIRNSRREIQSVVVNEIES